MTENEHGKIGGLLLAAGGSSRFGSPKQLALFKGKSLIRRSAEALAHSSCEPVVVVLGAETEASKAELADLHVLISYNADWKSGMSSSIRHGLNDLLKIDADVAAVMITLCDQPRVTSEVIERFAARFRSTRAEIIAAEYEATLGVPAILARPFFDQLLTLDGDQGAREIIRRHNGIVTIKMDRLASDIDTPADLESNLAGGAKQPDYVRSGESNE